MGLMVIDSGFWTTVQDSGRTGFREWGVPTGGAFDHGAADLGNALAGNPLDCAVLEMSLRGGVYEALGSVGVALAGAPMESSVCAVSGSLRRLRVPSSTTLQPGDRLVLGQAIDGAEPIWQSTEVSGPP